ncbi:MAG: hypothetical protein AAB686_01095, partial [Patescibacteria group bacterium]
PQPHIQREKEKDAYARGAADIQKLPQGQRANYFILGFDELWDLELHIGYEIRIFTNIRNTPRNNPKSKSEPRRKSFPGNV